MYEPHFSLSPKESLSIGLNKVSTTEVLEVTTALASNKNTTNLNTVKEIVLNSLNGARISEPQFSDADGLLCMCIKLVSQRTCY